MPLFKRSDGDLLPQQGLVRSIMPFVMPTRTESMVLYEQIVDLTATLPFIESWNEKHTQRLSLFDVVIAALGRALVERPGLDRFVSGGRLYQRKQTEIALTVKQELRDEAPIVTVKMKVFPGDTLEDTAKRLRELVREGRGSSSRPIDRELRLVLRLPSFVIRGLVRLARALDAVNLLPAFMIRDDPMYASIFVANLGSVGIDRVYHHLYEYGTAGLFCVIGAPGERVVPGPRGQPAVRRCVRLRYTFDERVNDGHYCAASLAIVKKCIEHPEKLAIGPAQNVAAAASRTQPRRAGEIEAGQ